MTEGPENTALVGRRVLVVEDEALVSMLIESMVDDFGGTVVGPFMHVGDALSFARDNSDAYDLAILDVNLSGQRSFPVAEVLSELGKPFVFSTGYDDRGLDERWRSWPSVRKPFSSRDLETALASVLGT